MAVLLLADVNGGQLAADSVAKALTGVAGLGEVHLLVAGPASAAGTTHGGHIPLPSVSTTSLQQGYTVASQPSMDNNSVDLDRERANFADNSVRYEATLRFINGQAKTMLSAIQGQ